MREAERRSFEASQADKKIIDEAAAWLRNQATEEAYAGLGGHQDVAYSLAAVLDVIALHIRDVEHGIRSQAVLSCKGILNYRDGITNPRRLKRRR